MRPALPFRPAIRYARSMTSLDKIERLPGAAGDSATSRAGRLTLELTETLKLAIPIALTQLGQIAMMTTDLALIGRLGDAAVAAAALAHTVFFVNFTFGMGLVAAGAPLAPPALGGPQPRPGGGGSRRSPPRPSAPAIRGRCGARCASGYGRRC